MKKARFIYDQIDKRKSHCKSTLLRGYLETVGFVICIFVAVQRSESYNCSVQVEQQPRSQGSLGPSRIEPWERGW